MKTDTGGAAYPSNFVDDREPSGFRDEPGMTLLDYFAGQAMKTILLSVFSSGGFTFKCDAAKGEIIGFNLLLPEKTQRQIFEAVSKLSNDQAEAMITEKRRREE